MSSDYCLSVHQQEEMLRWLDKFPLSRPNKKINRDFADGVLLAEILRETFPKLVEIHNYPPGCSMTHKMDNWLTLNHKVLRKIGLGLTKTAMDDLANAVPGAAESILCKVKDKIHEYRERQRGDNKICECFKPERSGDIFFVPRHKHQEENLQIYEEKVVVYSLYENLVKELSEQNEAVNILKQKVNHLDNLLHLKDQRISELTKQLGRKPRGVTDMNEMFK